MVFLARKIRAKGRSEKILERCAPTCSSRPSSRPRPASRCRRHFKKVRPVARCGVGPPPHVPRRAGVVCPVDAAASAGSAAAAGAAVEAEEAPEDRAALSDTEQRPSSLLAATRNERRRRSSEETAPRRPLSRLRVTIEKMGETDARVRVDGAWCRGDRMRNRVLRVRPPAALQMTRTGTIAAGASRQFADLQASPSRAPRHPARGCRQHPAAPLDPHRCARARAKKKRSFQGSRIQITCSTNAESDASNPRPRDARRRRLDGGHEVHLL